MRLRQLHTLPPSGGQRQRYYVLAQPQFEDVAFIEIQLSDDQMDLLMYVFRIITTIFF